jgi:hypothetical protein
MWCSTASLECEDGITLNAPTTKQNCSSDAFVLDLICSNISQMYINGLLEDRRCSQINLNIAKQYVHFCLVKADGTFCPEDESDKYITLLASNCDVEINNAGAVCTSVCRDTLVETMQGCRRLLYKRLQSVLG